MSATLQDPADQQLVGKIVYIEDDPISVVLVQSVLEVLYPRVELLHAATAVSGVRMVRQAHPNLVLLDMHLPGSSGIDVLRELTHKSVS